MREPKDWKNLNLGPGVRLLLGWREKRIDLDARPAQLSDQIGEEMRNAGRRTLDKLAEMDREDFSGVPVAEAGQYLSLDIESGNPDRGNGPLMPDEAAASGQLIALIRDSFDRTDFLTRGELKGGRWLFYTVIVERADSASPIAFVKEYNPQRGLNPGRLAVSADGDVLKHFDDPFLNFDLDFDLVVTDDEIAVVRVGAFNRVFADLELAKEQVPANAESVQSELDVAIAASASETLQEVCATSPSLAQRLRRLAHADYLNKVTHDSLRDALHRHGLRRDRFGRGDEVQLHDKDDVKQFLELVEGIYWFADFSGEPRKATRWARR